MYIHLEIQQRIHVDAIKLLSCCGNKLQPSQGSSKLSCSLRFSQDRDFDGLLQILRGARHMSDSSTGSMKGNDARIGSWDCLVNLDRSKRFGARRQLPR